MNKPDYYIRQKEAWDEAEVRQMRTEYLHDKMTISQIADIHQRTPGSISYKLKGLGFITEANTARGYSEYKSSDLYRAIVEKEKANPNPKPFARGNDLNIKVQVEHTELVTLKEEIATLKQDVKEVLRLIHAMYEVEA